MLSVSTFQITMLPSAKDKNFNAKASKKRISYYGEEADTTLVAMLAVNKAIEEEVEELKSKMTTCPIMHHPLHPVHRLHPIKSRFKHQSLHHQTVSQRLHNFSAHGIAQKLAKACTSLMFQRYRKRRNLF